jgi:hypothetical protein
MINYLIAYGSYAAIAIGLLQWLYWPWPWKR